VRQLPPLDLHAHIEPDIEARELVLLDAGVFAVTRSLDEANVALERNDRMTVWGVGCHPGLVGAQKAFSAETFERLLDQTALAGELGLDGKSRVAPELQRATFRSALAVLQHSPRITTIHSYAACGEVLDLLADVPITGAVLHWWLGSPEQTARALDLGCYFSINAAMLKRPELLQSMPLDRVLTETDHPFGDRAGGKHRRPGRVADVEAALAQVHCTTADEIRRQMWRNLRTLAFATGIGPLLPSDLRKQLAAL
jgi:TatD DNase family protein